MTVKCTKEIGLALNVGQKLLNFLSSQTEKDLFFAETATETKRQDNKKRLIIISLYNRKLQKYKKESS